MSEVQLEELKRRVDNIAPASPRGDVRRLTISPTENRILIEAAESDHKINNEYSLCCCKNKTDRRLLSFMAQFTFSGIIILFSIYQLSKTNNCPCSDNNFNNFYTSILMTTVGIWLPSPKALS
jgi:hypothetical protein